MNSMTKKQKACYIFLIIITFGLILIYWKKKYRQTKEKDHLSTTNKLDFNLDDFISMFGGFENITNSTSTNKIIKLEFKNKELVDIEKIKAFKQITGITLQSKSISLVMGNICPYLNDQINKEIKK